MKNKAEVVDDVAHYETKENDGTEYEKLDVNLSMYKSLEKIERIFGDRGEERHIGEHVRHGDKITHTPYKCDTTHPLPRERHPHSLDRVDGGHAAHDGVGELAFGLWI